MNEASKLECFLRNLQLDPMSWGANIPDLKGLPGTSALDYLAQLYSQHFIFFLIN